MGSDEEIEALRAALREEKAKTEVLEAQNTVLKEQLQRLVLADEKEPDPPPPPTD